MARAWCSGEGLHLADADRRARPDLERDLAGLTATCPSHVPDGRGGDAVDAAGQFCTRVLVGVTARRRRSSAELVPIGGAGTGACERGAVTEVPDDVADPRGECHGDAALRRRVADGTERVRARVVHPQVGGQPEDAGASGLRGDPDPDALELNAREYLASDLAGIDGCRSAAVEPE